MLKDEITDNLLAIVRIKLGYFQYDAHLGHVFPNDTELTRLHYCINTAS